MRKHTKEVDENRHVLSRIIDCVKFCSAFKLALHGHDETDSSEYSCIFHCLVDFVASLDSVLEEHLKTATVFKETSKMVQNELLRCMFSVVRSYIQEEVKNGDFVAIQATMKYGSGLWSSLTSRMYPSTPSVRRSWRDRRPSLLPRLMTGPL